jgi:pimeloyl-ACP methyl ester carboxylesterase
MWGNSYPCHSSFLLITVSLPEAEHLVRPFFLVQLMSDLRQILDTALLKPAETVFEQSSRLEVGRDVVTYVVEGRGTETVVLINGGVMDFRQWDEVASNLAASYRVLRWDPRGWGASPNATEPFSNVTDLASLLDHLKLTRVHLVGLSAGGGIALDFALTHPDRVSRLVLVAPAVRGWAWSESFQKRGAELAQAARSRDEAALGTALLDDPWFAPTLKSRPDAAGRVRELARANRKIFRTRRNLEDPEPPALGRLGDLRARTLVILPQLDHPDLHAIADTLQSRSTLVSVRRIPKAGHMVHLERPREFVLAVTRFLEKRT